MKVYSLETVFKNIYIRIQKEYLFVFKKSLIYLRISEKVLPLHRNPRVSVTYKKTYRNESSYIRKSKQSE